jgi:tryptophan synthase alpha chain
LSIVKLNEYIASKTKAGGSVYMPYLTMGDPSYEKTVEYALGMIDAGADLLEIGIPFSDPTADGPVIQAAMVRSLERTEFSLDRLFAAVEKIHAARPEVPLVFLSYMNPILNGFAENLEYGRADLTKPVGQRLQYDAPRAIDTFLLRCQAAGVRGLVIPDLPFDSPESRVLRERGAELGVDQILLVAPNTTDLRLEGICNAARGFIYYVTSMGVTGMRAELPPDLRERIDLVKAKSGLPVFAGFGFSEPEQARALRGQVDGIIVGSLNHRIIAEHGEESGGPLTDVTRGFAAACHADGA